MAEKRLTELNDNDRINLTIGDKIIIELESNPGTGFDWVPTKKSEVHFDNFSTDYKSIPGNNAPGSAEISIINFSAIKKGTGEIILQYIQPWNPAIIDRTFKVQYKID